MDLQAITFGRRPHELNTLEPSATAELSPEIWREKIAAAYRPILRGFLLPATFYYGLIAVLHFFFQTPEHVRILAPLAGTTALSSLLLYLYMRKHAIGYVHLELCSIAIYSMVFANILVHHLLHLEPPKLVYFMLLTIAVATSGVSLRMIIPASVISLATSILLAGRAGPEIQQQFAFIALASSFVALGMAVLMRMAIKREISARYRAEKAHEAAERAAEYDFLTGLPNRRNFFRRLSEAYDDPSRNGHLALGLIDLNGFKHINDLYGHVFGDQLLAKVGERLGQSCDGLATAARLGGDEFAILLERPASDAALRAIGSDICEAVGQCYLIAGIEISVSVAIGFARRLATTANPAMLYEHADFALYRAKGMSSDHVAIFSLADEAELETIRCVEQHLSGDALEDEMHVEYQPMILVAENRVIGFEALARWQSPQLGNVAPDVFIRAAERCGIMNRLTPTLLRKALADAVSWPEDLCLSFNLSARDVVSAESIEHICEVVAESGFPGSRLDFEITETSIMTDFARVRDSLAKLRALGAHIALDDFGVGYSNFQHLDELAIDKLKIDRRFVSRIGSPENPGRILTTMIEMCANLGLACVVEGVETGSELRAVLGAGGTIIQGFYFSRPMRGERVLPFLDHGLDSPDEEIRRSA